MLKMDVFLRKKFFIFHWLSWISTWTRSGTCLATLTSCSSNLQKDKESIFVFESWKRKKRGKVWDFKARIAIRVINGFKDGHRSDPWARFKKVILLHKRLTKLFHLFCLWKKVSFKQLEMKWKTEMRTDKN